eukprot:403355000
MGAKKTQNIKNGIPITKLYFKWSPVQHSTCISQNKQSVPSRLMQQNNQKMYFVIYGCKKQIMTTIDTIDHFLKVWKFIPRISIMINVNIKNTIISAIGKTPISRVLKYTKELESFFRIVSNTKQSKEMSLLEVSPKMLKALQKLFRVSGHYRSIKLVEDIICKKFVNILSIAEASQFESSLKFVTIMNSIYAITASRMDCKSKMFCKGFGHSSHLLTPDLEQILSPLI